MKKYHGFNLIELMVTLVVATILIGIAAPSLSNLYDAQRANSAIREIQQTLQFGRNAAISYGLRVTICPLKDNQCDDNWQNGLTVFTDSGVLNQLDNSDQLLLTTGPFNSNDSVTYNRDAIRFLPDGLASGTNGTLIYCPRSTDNPNARAVIVNQAGRVRFSNKKDINCIK